MCAVIGFQGKGSKQTSERLLTLFNESKIRGLHAFGLAYYNGPKLFCARFSELDMAQTHLRVVASQNISLKLIAHCRYSTSGDWKDETNNQPIYIDGVAMAFNGVIRMSTKKEWGKEFGFKPITDNDGEIFVRKVLAGEDWVTWVATGEFSFAGVMLHNKKLVALRNKQRPLWRVQDNGSNYFASTRDIFERAGFKDAKPVPPGYALAV
jgi:glutamine phosphoribosylpyrophosphate amidotransferase